MLFQQITLLLLQAIVLVGIVGIASLGRRNVFQQFCNPACWFTLFFVLWFWIPQLVSIYYENHLVGFEESTAELVREAQVYLIGFLLAVWTGIMLVRAAIDRRIPDDHFPTRPLTKSDRWILGLFYLAGLAATLYLGRKLMNIEGYRSGLVKTQTGLVLTTVGFFGIFAMSVFVGHALAARRYVAALLIGGLFATAVFFTGARGRVLWPIAVAIAYSWSRGNRVRYAETAVFLVIGVTVLVAFDPLLMVLRDGWRYFTIDRVTDRIDLADIYLNKRNFDGFSNFTLITTQDHVTYSWSYLLKGGRYPFMTTYFPGTLESGVGFGTTIPGLFWLAGGLKGLLLCGMGFGVFIGLMNWLFTKITVEPLIWTYLFAMTWLVALNGNLPESLDKMVAASFPGVAWWGLLALLPRNRRPPAPVHGVASSRGSERSLQPADSLT